MKASFNLIDQPWIPCLSLNGDTFEFSLQATLNQSHQLREIAGESPLVIAAIYRLLLAILYRVFPPTSVQEWGSLWQAGCWDANKLDNYCQKWHHRFDLFDSQRPFYQVVDARVKPKSVISIIPDMASGNNATLFDHHTEDVGTVLSPSQSARALLVAQTFGLRGLSGLEQKFTDAPWARGVIFLVTGNSLFETLALNFFNWYDNQQLPNTSDDCPAWEMDDPYLPPRTIPKGYLDYLTWQNRRILLVPQENSLGTAVSRMTVAPGLRVVGNEAFRDPMKHYRKDDKRGLLVLRFTEERALWRDSAAFLRIRNPPNSVPPYTFRWLSRLVDAGIIQAHQTYQLKSLGMANDQAKVEFFRAEHLPLPVCYLSEAGLELLPILEEAVTMSEVVSKQLYGALRTLATLLLSSALDQGNAHKPAPEDLDSLKAHWGIERFYWSRLELPFIQLLEVLPHQKREITLSNWRQTVIKTVWFAFNQAEKYISNRPQALKAIVQARAKLRAGLAKALPEPT